MKGFSKYMEQILYKNYLKYLKEKKTPLYKVLLSIPKCAAGLLMALVLLCAISLMFLCVEELRQYFIIPLAVETIFCIIAYFYSEHYEINNSEKHMNNFIKSIVAIFTLGFKIHQYLLLKIALLKLRGV